MKFLKRMNSRMSVKLKMHAFLGKTVIYKVPFSPKVIPNYPNVKINMGHLDSHIMVVNFTTSRKKLFL